MKPDLRLAACDLRPGHEAQGALRATMLRAMLLLLATGALAACGSRPPDESHYLQDVQSARAEKDASLRAAGSPIPPDAYGKFLPLSYFPVDVEYSVPAAFRENPPGSRQRVEMQTSSHEPRQMERTGTLEFTLQGQPMRLAAYVEVGQRDDRLFVPFTDLTTGKETYPAGRYLDIARSPTGVYVVDFNLAYNPYCYYNPTYDCPYPPKENRLQVAIRAGEKIR
jgi:uncharacterized protein (DUF1684 family)